MKACPFHVKDRSVSLIFPLQQPPQPTISGFIFISLNDWRHSKQTYLQAWHITNYYPNQQTDESHKTLEILHKLSLHMESSPYKMLINKCSTLRKKSDIDSFRLSLLDGVVVSSSYGSHHSSCGDIYSSHCSTTDWDVKLWHSIARASFMLHVSTGQSKTVLSSFLWEWSGGVEKHPSGGCSSDCAVFYDLPWPFFYHL